MRDIIDGWFNFLKFWLGFESPGMYKMARYRGKICKMCEYRKGWIKHCELCGCVIEAKIRCEDCVCPDVRW